MIPILLGGTGRCGTTLLSNILGKMPDVVALPTETCLMTANAPLHQRYTALKQTALLDLDTLGIEFEDHQWRRNLGIYPDGMINDPHWENRGDFIDAVDDVDTEGGDVMKILRELADVVLDRGCDYIVDHTPGNMWTADFIAELYPEAKMVHVMRDPRDVMSSVLSLSGWVDNPDDGLEWLTTFYKHAQKMHDRFDIHVVPIDRLGFTKVTNNLARYLGLKPVLLHRVIMVMWKLQLPRWLRDPVMYDHYCSHKKEWDGLVERYATMCLH